VLFAEVVQVLNALDDARVRHWVGGGWGVATLVGRQSREHRDLDIAIDADDLQICLRTLNDLGYLTEVDWLPVRIELGALGNRWVCCCMYNDCGPYGTAFTPLLVRPGRNLFFAGRAS
jgi:hypothetical protein